MTHDGSPASLDPLTTAIREAARSLPAQNPIRDFVHHNTLHAYEDLPFFEAVRAAWSELGVEGTLSLQELRALHAAGRIRTDDLRAELAEAGLSATATDVLLYGDLPTSDGRRIGARVPSLRDVHLFAAGENLEALVRPPLVRFLGGYLDRGAAAWSMPVRHLPLAEAWLAVQAAGLGTLAPQLRDAVDRLRRLGARGLVADVLDELHVPAGDVVSFLRAELFVMPGWAGMVRRIPHPEATSLEQLTDYLAVRLAKEVAALRGRHRSLGRVWARASQARLGLPSEEATPGWDDQKARAVFQRAYERRYRQDLLAGLAAAPRSDPAAPTSFVLVTCFDDREESFRRHVEERDPSVVTYGVAGFFGLPLTHRTLGAADVEERCPVGVEGLFTSEEAPISDDEAEAWLRRRASLGALRRWEHASSRTLAGSTALALARGALDAAAFAATLVAPWGPHALRRAVGARLAPVPDSVPDVIELDVEAAASALAALFRTAGIETERLPRLVLFVGHGASSVNNPHAAAYACGACRGRDGAANARLAAVLANRPDVRAQLRALECPIPEGTVFVGGLHDTTTDEVSFADAARLSADHRAELNRALSVLDDALGENARERCRRLASAPRRPTRSAARAHVARRATDPSEVRPELGHATVAAAVVGRRALTRGLFLDRRVFLVSYDPTVDPAGALLERLLAAALPVGAGIALEYHWSRVDPNHLGAGTKLPHNPVGHVGVMEGSHGDLRTGLPVQMTEIHEPMRLQVVVEATPDTLSRVLSRRSELRRLVEHEWVILLALDPTDRTPRRFVGGRFVAEHVDAPVARARSSAEWTGDREGPLPPARIDPGGPA